VVSLPDRKKVFFWLKWSYSHVVFDSFAFALTLISALSFPPLNLPVGDSLQSQLVDFADDDVSFQAKWHRLIKNFHRAITNVLVSLARVSALNPKRTISLVIFLSLAVLVIGLLTGFNVDVNEDTLWSPIGSRSRSHFEWIEDESGFPKAPRIFFLNIHANGDNVLGKEGVDRAFIALNIIRDTSGYAEVCKNGGESLPDGTKTCRIISATSFWSNTLSIFEEEVMSDEDAIIALSNGFYPDGAPVDHLAILGTPEFDERNVLTSALVYTMQIHLPRTDEAGNFEEVALANIKRLQDQWEQESNNSFNVEYLADRSFSDEFTRAIITDIPLMPVAFIIMSIFTCMVYFKRDRVQSRTMLGFGAVCSVFLAIASGFGLLFICGIPFTSMTQLLPFIMFGIGLDAAFILCGSFCRTSKRKRIVQRIEETVEDVGLSIALTTLTSTMAFALGCISTIPAVRWLCLYAFPTIIIDLIYQLSFFVAIMAIDEQRVQENRQDILCCLKSKEEPPKADVNNETEEVAKNQNEEHCRQVETEILESKESEESTSSQIDRFMIWFADKILMNGSVKTLIVLAFVGMLAGCAYSASLLEQNFDFTEVIPDDSYITPFFDVLNGLTDRGGAIADVYFRNEDQSSIVIQAQMNEYVDALVDLSQIDNQPALFWLRDFQTYINQNENLQNITFYEQFEFFFNDPIFNSQYSNHIVLDENGKITASRTTVYMNNINDDIVVELIDALEDQRAVSASQSINQGKKDWSFFTYSSVYLIWEFYSVAVEELILSTILGVVSVSVVAMIFIPHWTAVLFLGPLICVLYIDLLGVLQLAGLAINPVSYISLVMSIGLLVDFIVHVLLRYYELKGDRTTRTKEMLRTMGSSVLLGGISTFLGVLPLAISTSTIFYTVFVTFLGLVTLGIGHGLILLPVLLSVFGPESKEVIL